MDISKLVEQTKTGDNKSFDKLYKLTEKEIWFTCISFLKNETTAQDIMQETYITAFLKIQTLDKTAQFRSWLNRIAVNKCKDYLKGKGEIELNDEILENSLVADEISLPEEYVTNKSKRECILSIMQKTLSDVQYQTVICYFFNEMSVEEIATLFECSKGTVLSRLNYSRAKMKTAIEKYEEENNDRLHGVVFLPLFSSIFKEEAKNLTVPKIDLVLPKQGSNSIASFGAESAVKTTSKGLVSSVLKARVIAVMCGMVILTGSSLSTGVLAGCGREDLPIATNASTTEVTTEPTEPTEETKPTVSEEVKEAVKDNGLKVNDKGEVVDAKGNKVEVKDGKVEVTTDDGKKVIIKVDEVKEVTQLTKGTSSEPKETQKVTQKPTQKATQPTTKKPSVQPTTKKPATPTPTQKPTQKPTVKPTQPATQKPTEKPKEKVWVVDYKEVQVKVVDKEAYTYEEPVYETQRRTICNACGEDMTYFSNSEIGSHQKAHMLNGENCSYTIKNVQVQVGTKTITVPEEFHYETKKVENGGHWEYK